MRWPSKGKPEIYQRGKWWTVRWYDPVSKRARALKTKSDKYAHSMWQLMLKEEKL